MATGTLENHSEFPKYQVWSSLALIDELFGLVIPKSRFEEWAEFAFDTEIQTNIALVKSEVTVLDNGYVKLPCEAKIIKAVTSDLITFSKWNAINIGYDDLKSIDGFYYYKDGSQNTALPKGNYINYDFVDTDTIKVESSLVGNSIYVLMYANNYDPEGWPMLTKKQMIALAWYVAFLHCQREAFRGIEMKIDLNYVRTEAFRKLAAAKIPEYISDNQMDQILNAKFSYNRKRYNTDFTAEGSASRNPRELNE